MKKKYILPCSYVIRIKPSSIIAGSLFDSTNVGDQTVTPDYSEPAPDEFTSRRHNDMWEEEDF